MQFGSPRFDYQTAVESSRVGCRVTVESSQPKAVSQAEAREHKMTEGVGERGRKREVNMM